jgi:hypothetical protein
VVPEIVAAAVVAMPPVAMGFAVVQDKTVAAAFAVTPQSVAMAFVVPPDKYVAAARAPTAAPRRVDHVKHATLKRATAMIYALLVKNV